jgi:hypothetical protein
MESMPKQYLYHRVPENMMPNEEGKKIIYPLNILKEKFPGLYELEIKKYTNRGNIPETIIPTMNAVWGDVVQLTAIHPEELKKELVKAGFEPKELKFYQIDPEMLSSEDTTVFLYKDDIPDDSLENFENYEPSKLNEHSVIPEDTKKYYRNQSSENKRPWLFIRIPHIFHKGEIDVSDFPIITV